MTSEPLDPALSVAATGLLGKFHQAGVIGWAEVHTARQVCHLYQEASEEVALALAVTVRALGLGSVCLDLGSVTSGLGGGDEPLTVPSELWPDLEAWYDLVAGSRLVSVGADGPPGRPLRLIGRNLYLERYWQEEERVRLKLGQLVDRALPGNLDATAHLLDGLFVGDHQERQRAAARQALGSGLTVIAGGPGTGKTTAIARLLVALLAEVPTRRIALAAPTGKAAARLDEALQQGRGQLAAEDSRLLAGLSARTLHRLLGWRPDSSSRFVHDRDNPLPYDVVVVDETSMVSLTLMSRLLEAIGPWCRLILVGDPDQLASVEAGAVLADLTGATWTQRAAGLPKPVVTLAHNFRFTGAIGGLASAIRDGDAEAALDLLRSGGPIALLGPSEVGDLRQRVLDAGRAVERTARALDLDGALAALDAHRLLCAHRQGPFGVSHWSRVAESWLRTGIDGFGREGEWYVGRPLLITSNTPDLGLFNGDTGVVVRIDDRPRVAFNTGGRTRTFSPYLLGGAQTVLAMTVHKAQGSQFEQVSVVLPPPDSPLLTRELLYTAVTRARAQVTLIGTEEAVRKAIAQPALRASGLRDRL